MNALEIAAEQSSRSETRLCTAAEGFAERLALFLRGLRDELRMVVDPSAAILHAFGERAREISSRAPGFKQEVSSVYA